MAQQAVKVDAKVAYKPAMDALEALIPGIEKRLAEVKLATIKRLEAAARTAAPKRTGKYASTITGDFLSAHPAAVQKSSKGATKTTGARYTVAGTGTGDPWAVGLFAHYRWAWLEFGTVKMSPRPHIFPAWRTLRPKLRRAMSSALSKEIKKEVAKANAKTAALEANAAGKVPA